jgi:hypothetical protein
MEFYLKKMASRQVNTFWSMMQVNYLPEYIFIKYKPVILLKQKK